MTHDALKYGDWATVADPKMLEQNPSLRGSFIHIQGVRDLGDGSVWFNGTLLNLCDGKLECLSKASDTDMAFIKRIIPELA